MAEPCPVGPEDAICNYTYDPVFLRRSAGYKAFGEWGGSSYGSLVGNIRAICHLLESRYEASLTYVHVPGHCGDPGNEAADTIAKIHTFDPRAQSPWIDYLDRAEPVEIQWIWALWKPEWKNFWKGRNLVLPCRPLTTPSVDVFGIEPTPTGTTPPVAATTSLACLVSSANVLTLLPAKKNTELGIQGRARSEALQKTFDEAGYHIVGVQETRLRKEPKIEQDLYFVFSAAATARGTFGIQIWFSRKHSLSPEGHFFKRDHFKILARDPRFLIIKVAAPFLRTIVVAAHAPTSQATSETVEQWWLTLSQTIPARFSQWPRILLVDANARLGSFPSRAVGSHHEDDQDTGGEFFHDFLIKNNQWVPATFPGTQDGPGGTWRHPRTEEWIRGDYVCLPQQWQLTSCRAYVDRELDISLRVDDHSATSVYFTWQDDILPEGPKRRVPAPSLALSDLRADLSGPDREAFLTEIIEAVPRCPWHLDVHSHTLAVQQGLQRWLFRRYARTTKAPLRQHMSAPTWQLIQEKQEIRRRLFSHNGPCKETPQRIFPSMGWPDSP